MRMEVGEGEGGLYTEKEDYDEDEMFWMLGFFLGG